MDNTKVDLGGEEELFVWYHCEGELDTDIMSNGVYSKCTFFEVFDPFPVSWSTSTAEKRGTQTGM